MTQLVRATCFAERKNAIDDRRELTRVDDLRDLDEVPGPEAKIRLRLHST
jgi:hypothetical protein